MRMPVRRAAPAIGAPTPYVGGAGPTLGGRRPSTLEDASFQMLAHSVFQHAGAVLLDPWMSGQ